MAVDARDVYLLDVDTYGGETQIRRVARSGGAIAMVAELPFGANSLVVDAQYLYWLRQGVRAMPKAGGESQAVAPVKLVTEGRGEGSLLLDDTHLYWSDWAVRRVERLH